MAKHQHRPSEKAWKNKYGSWSRSWSGISVNNNFHGYCEGAGHIISDICSCGAERYFCPVTNRRKWFAPLGLPNNMYQPATYVTIWDASEAIRTNCEIDTIQDPPRVRNVEMIDEVEGLSTLNEEYVELNGEKFESFFNEDIGLLVVDRFTVEA
jgi:hypothetical protein